MFRLLRTFPVLRQPLLCYPQPRRLPSPPYRRSISLRNGPHTVHTVVLKGPSNLGARLFPIVKRLAWVALFCLVLNTLFEIEEEVEISTGSKVGDDDGVEKKDEGKESAQQEEDTIFIPLGYPYTLPQTFYKGSDPEWQSFVRLARNRKKCDALKNELTGLVGRYVGALPQMEKVLGKGNKPKKYWLDIDYPPGPPPQYERKGLEIGKDISWTTRSVHPLNYAKLQNALWPEPLALSSWAACRTMASLQYTRVKRHLKFGSEPQSSSLADAPEMSLQKVGQNLSPPEQESAPASENGQATEGAASAGTVEQSQMSEAPPDSGNSFQLQFPPPGMGEDLAAAGQAFQTTFAQTWRPASAPPERGTVFFSGMIELVGPKGIVVLEASAAYHAADSRWTKVAVAVRRVASRKQAPRGR
ncbi:MAG: hypothetical protein Q9224_003070 [Gallowayella concinna]